MASPIGLAQAPTPAHTTHPTFPSALEIHCLDHTFRLPHAACCSAPSPNISKEPSLDLPSRVPPPVDSPRRPPDQEASSPLLPFYCSILRRILSLLHTSFSTKNPTYAPVAVIRVISTRFYFLIYLFCLLLPEAFFSCTLDGTFQLEIFFDSFCLRSARNYFFSFSALYPTPHTPCAEVRYQSLNHRRRVELRNGVEAHS